MTERERFERWARRRGLPLIRCDLSYKEDATHYAWLGWQVRARMKKTKKPKSGNYSA